MIFSALMDKEIIGSREGGSAAVMLAFETFDFWPARIALACSFVADEI